MNKKLLALAALSALAGGASAQSSVTLYGVVDVGIEQTRLSPGSNTLRLSSGIQSGSRWGVKGKEDLGGGLSASFQLEAGFDATTGARGQGGLAFGRQSWVGLDGAWGSVKLGRQYVPFFLAQDTIDPFGTGIIGDGSGMSAVFRPYGVRMDNTINYSTPNFGGLSAEVAYGMGEISGSTSRGSQYGFAAYYDKSPVTAVLAYHKQNLVGQPGNVDAGEARSWLVGGVFDFKAAKLHAAYADNRDETAGGATFGRSRDWMLGVSAPVGPVTVMASYIRHKDRQVGNADADFWGLGATYALSKRTNFYASYSRVNNDALGASGTGLTGVDATWLNVGIRHRF
ncbi:porin [Ramlibacter sp.]|uniref:porin n=1 Tax=Ramlibacter sp. TaxID=1917967 RepID=UPI0017AADA5B|nr:porin [Ramlibacter sp.]MBA2673163.1 porin [Ramlibacter sp.]